METKLSSKFFLPGMPVMFVDPKATESHEGRIWKVYKVLQNGKIEIITIEEDITEEVCSDEIRFDGKLGEFCTWLVNAGRPFRIDFKKKTLNVDGVMLANGDDTILPLAEGKASIPGILEELESLYYRYKRSIPSKKDTDHPSKYFRALKEEDLTNEDMMYGEQRNAARFRLEFCVLQEIIKGTLTWDMTVFGKGTWFWQSLKDKDLVIFKDWIPQFKEV